MSLPEILARWEAMGRKRNPDVMPGGRLWDEVVAGYAVRLDGGEVTINSVADAAGMSRGTARTHRSRYKHLGVALKQIGDGNPEFDRLLFDRQQRLLQEFWDRLGTLREVWEDVFPHGDGDLHRRLNEDEDAHDGAHRAQAILKAAARKRKPYEALWGTDRIDGAWGRVSEIEQSHRAWTGECPAAWTN